MSQENVEIVRRAFAYEIHGVGDRADRVLVITAGEAGGSGIEVDTRFFLVYSLRNGKVVRSDKYADRAEALNAAGLSE